jgi:type IV pilus assembly protein PilY1
LQSRTQHGLLKPVALPFTGEIMTQHLSRASNNRHTAWHVRMLCAFLAFSQTWVLAAPAQKPLLTASAPPLPNVVLTLDDSGSMNFHMMPESIGDVNTYTTQTNTVGITFTKRPLNTITTNGNRRNNCSYYFSNVHTSGNTVSYTGANYPPSNTAIPPVSETRAGRYTNFAVRSTCYSSDPITQDQVIATGSTIRVNPSLHPNDTTGYPRSTSITAGWNISGVVDTNEIGFNGFFNQFGYRFRSVDFNANYYNPAVTYVPWPAGARNINSNLIDADGYPDNAQKTPIYPEGDHDSTSGTSSATVDLVSSLSLNTQWCAEGMTSTSNAYTVSSTPSNYTVFNCESATRSFQPAVYFKLKSNADGSKMSGTSATDFERVDINLIGAQGVTKASTRTDCAGSTCTKAEELRNFSTWFTYYRNRALVAKGAVALAFDRQPKSKFRLGWGSINNTNGNTTNGYKNGEVVSADGFSNNTLTQGVREFDDAHQVSFFGWLRPLPTIGGTPLHRAMNDIGKYFSEAGKTSSGDPYREKPTESTYEALSCRRNYQIFVTDGYWNGAVVDQGNVDGTSDTAPIPNNGTGLNKAPNYTYTATKPFTDGQKGTLADLAMYYWKRDLRSDLANNIPVSKAAGAAQGNYKLNPAYWQHMQNFTVGLGVDGQRSSTDANGNAVDPNSFSWPTVTSGQQTTIDDLWHAAVNSRGQYLKATDPIAFSDALGDILSKITSTGGTVSGVTVSSSYVADDTLKLVPSFEPESWSGELQGVTINASGKEQSTPAPWSASQKLPSHELRNIWMGTGSTAVPFKHANFPEKDNLFLGHVRTSSGAGVEPVLNESLVNYLRGDRTNEGDEASKPYRPRNNALGSFVNSLPIYVKAANFDNIFLPSDVNGKPTGASSYNSFVKTKKLRNGLAIIGGNDGMLHGFRATDGVEVFAYIPKTVLNGESHPLSSKDNTNLYGLARLSNKGYTSLFFMDGQITEGDITSTCTTTTSESGKKTTTCDWTNMVAATAGGGAKSVFALDVTDNFNAPTDTTSTDTSPKLFNASNVMWEIGKSNKDLGYVMSAPQIGLLASGDWAVIFGNGNNSDNDKATLFIVNARTGDIIQTITPTADAEKSNGLGGVRLVRGLNNVIQHVYAGDLQGNVWKFDLTDKDPNNWGVDIGGKPLFTAMHDDVPQPITAAPNFAIHPKKGLMVYVSTGKLSDEDDLDNNTQQTIYGLWDQANIGTASTESNQVPANKLITQVVQVTNQSEKANTKTFKIVADSSNSAITEKRGWKLNMLFDVGERGIYSPQFLQGYVFVETVKPGAAGKESCETAEGSGYGYLLNLFSGAQPTTPILDMDASGTIGDLDSADNAGVFKRKTTGQGAVQKGSPKGALSGTGSDAQGTAASDTSVDRSWRQIFWLIN